MAEKEKPHVGPVKERVLVVKRDPASQRETYRLEEVEFDFKPKINHTTSTKGIPRKKNPQRISADARIDEQIKEEFAADLRRLRETPFQPRLVSKPLARDYRREVPGALFERQ